MTAKVIIGLATALTLLVALHPVKGAENKPDAKTFPAFWAQFKTALANKDKEAIAGMTKFPFVYGGAQFTRAEFIKRYDEIFTGKERACFRSAKPVKDERESFSVFCGHSYYLFEKGNGGYQFTDVGEND